MGSGKGVRANPVSHFLRWGPPGDFAAPARPTRCSGEHLINYNRSYKMPPSAAGHLPDISTGVWTALIATTLCTTCVRCSHYASYFLFIVESTQTPQSTLLKMRPLTSELFHKERLSGTEEHVSKNMRFEIFLKNVENCSMHVLKQRSEKQSVY